MNAKCVTVTRKGKFEVIIMIKSLVVLLLFALVIYAFLTFIYFVFDVLKWHNPDCRKESDRQKTALRVYNLRQRKKQKDKFRDEQLELLKVENELLRKKVLMLREEAGHIR